MFELPLIIGSFVAGVLMFLAPCTLPIVPGYLAFIAGVPLSALQNPSSARVARRAVLRNALAFVLGFSLVFIALGASAGLIGSLVGPWRYLIARAGGVIIIIFGLTMLGLIPLSLINRERHVRLPSFLVLGRTSSSALIGAIFALGWSPCIGPILGTVLLIASNGATAAYGALLLAMFSLGLAVPFLLCAYLISEASVFLSRISGFVRVLSLVGGTGLVLAGILMLTGDMAYFSQWGYELFHAWGYDALLDYL
jgi:cytochrome c-type biogenesis protein